MPFVQHAMGDFASQTLSELIHADAKVGKVRLGLFNRLIIDDIEVKDQKGDEMLKVARTSVNVDIIPLFNGKIVINTAQVFGLKAILHQANYDTPSNFQFIIDAFKSDNEEPSSPIDLQVKSFIMRRATIKWDIDSAPQTENKFNADHLDLKDINITLALKHLTSDTLNLAIKRFNAIEQNSSLTLTDLKFKLEAGKNKAHVSDFCFLMPRSEIYADSINLSYSKSNETLRYHYSTRLDHSFITLSDLAPVLPSLTALDKTYNIQSEISGNQSDIENLLLNVYTEDDELNLASHCRITNIDTTPNIAIDDFKLKAKKEHIQALLEPFDIEDDIYSKLNAIGDVDIDATLAKNGTIIDCDAIIDTSVGDMELSAVADVNENITVKSASVSVSELDLMSLGLHDFGDANFDLTITGDYDTKKKQLGQIIADAQVGSITFKGHEYKDINLTGNKIDEVFNFGITSNDEDASLTFNGQYDARQPHRPLAEAFLSLKHLNPYALNLDTKNPSTAYSLGMQIKLSGKDINDMTGAVNVDSIIVFKEGKPHHFQSVSLDIQPSEKHHKKITINSNILKGTISGIINYTDILASINNQMSNKLPAFFNEKRANANDFSFNLEVRYDTLLNNFLHLPLETRKPVHLSGFVNDNKNSMKLFINTNRLIYDNNRFDSLNVEIVNNAGLMNCEARFRRRIEDDITDVRIIGEIFNNNIKNSIYLADVNQPEHKGAIHTITSFTDSLGKIKTTVGLKASTLSFNDKEWTIHPSSIDVYGNVIQINNLHINNDEQYLKANGRISQSISDSLLVDLKDVNINYVTNLVNFHSVELDGYASGRAVISGLHEKTPEINANLRVKDLSLQGGVLGFAEINAKWDDQVNGIGLKAHIVDHNGGGITNLDGFVSPGDEKIDLMINLNKTPVGCLNGFIGSIFKDIKGTGTGYINVVGPLNDIGLVGDVSTDLDLTLRATGVTYHTLGDTLRFRPYKFYFNNMRLADKKNNIAIVNGTVGHGNLKNFNYTFDLDFNQFCCYDEHEFNSDKFLGTVYANGNLHLSGSDGHPLNINAHISPTRGSIFAYDTASPDALTNSTFITYRDRSQMQPAIGADYFNNTNNTKYSEDKEEEEYFNNTTDEQPEYTGDIFMNIDIELNPNCEIRLRMEETAQDDGYMSTYGTGTITCNYYNKGPFTMFGNYDIQGGRYRMYLHDIIYRDLELQPTSRVAFNGNPFDAGIHLLCHHTLPAVPLTDLAVTGGNQNNKVKVVCILDITGQLGNMKFNFDLDLPNVSEETRQLVRSMISTEEEMNTQLIYLLGLGRFYSSEYARATNNIASSGAMSSLLSSTLSGQLNQMLSNIIGNNSNWNFGTSLSTGEYGWEDMDVEGVLSGRLLDDRLLINGNFGYRENSIKRNASFVGDFDLRWRLRENGNTFLKVYNQTNDRYFTKATLTTQGIGITYQKDFERFSDLIKRKRRKEAWERFQNDNQERNDSTITQGQSTRNPAVYMYHK